MVVGSTHNNNTDEFTTLASTASIDDGGDVHSVASTDTASDDDLDVQECANILTDPRDTKSDSLDFKDNFGKWLKHTFSLKVDTEAAETNVCLEAHQDKDICTFVPASLSSKQHATVPPFREVFLNKSERLNFLPILPSAYKMEESEQMAFFADRHRQFYQEVRIINSLIM